MNSNNSKFEQTIRFGSFIIFVCLIFTDIIRFSLIFLIGKMDFGRTQISIDFCILESFLVHVFTLFHFHLTIYLRIFWHYCSLFDCLSQHRTVTQISLSLALLMFCSTFLTSPILSHQWAKMTHDRILNLCIIDYTLDYSYTIFIVTLTGLIPFSILLVSNYFHAKTINRRLNTALFLFKEQNYILTQKKYFRLSSWMFLLWTFLQLLLFITLHIPIVDTKLRHMTYVIQLISFLISPTVYLASYRSLSMIVLLKCFDQTSFV